VAQEPWEICPPEDRLAAYAEKRLGGKYNEWTWRHLKFCSACMRKMAKIKRVPDPGEIIAGGSVWERLRRLWRWR